MHLKEELAVVFQHKMLLTDFISEEPEFARKYEKALELWHEYRKQFVSGEEDQAGLRGIGSAGLQSIKNLCGGSE